MDQLSHYFDKTVLSWLVALPFLGALAILFTPRQSRKPAARRVGRRDVGSSWSSRCTC